jgi:Tfp pilus assembly protein PilV
MFSVRTIKDQKGIGLVEAILALGVAVIVITSLVSLSVFTLRSSTKGKLLLRGSKLSSTELELIRAYKDSGISWASFINAVDGCEASPCHMIASGGLGIASNERVLDAGTALETGISFTASDPVNGDGIDPTDSVVRVSVRVRWLVAGADNYSYINTDLANWRAQ